MIIIARQDDQEDFFHSAPFTCDSDKWRKRFQTNKYNYVSED